MKRCGYLPPTILVSPVEIDLDTNTTTGADTLAYVTSQLVGGMSFSMANGFEDYSESEEMDTAGKKQKILTVSKFTCDEVSPVAAPAFMATTLGLKTPMEVLEPLEPLPAGRLPWPEGWPPRHPTGSRQPMQSTASKWI